jgi:glucosyltransferase
MDCTLSLIVPAYNEQETLETFYLEAERVTSSMGVKVEYLFVDDGSRDKTLEILQRMASRDSRVHYISFSRNFGKEAAIYAGLKNAVGDYVALLDADLQDPPALLPQMMDLILQEGYDCVGSRRVTRKGEPPIRSFFARMFYRLINRLSQTEIVDGARDFQLMTRQVVNAILSMGEYNRFSKGIFGWVGFRKTWLEYENIERSAGESKWSFGKLFLYAIDGLVAFTTFPLALPFFFGGIFLLIALILLIAVLVQCAALGMTLSMPLLMIGVIMLLMSIPLFCTGILGKYLEKTYMETKRRPLYITRKSNLSKEK